MLPKFRYNIRLTQPNSGGKSSVIIRVSFQGSRVDLYSGITLTKKQWDSKKERVKQGCNVDGYEYNVLNNSLNEKEQFINDYFNNCAIRSTIASLKDLKERFNYRFKSKSSNGKRNEFFYYFQLFRSETEKTKGWQKDMKDVMERLENKINEFNPNIRFEDLTISTMDSLKEYLSLTMYNDALIKHLSYLKQFIKWASLKKLPIHEEYLFYAPKLPKAKKAVRYLEIEEIDRIWDLSFKKDEGLERVRDIFIFMCYTGLRFSDIKQLKREHIIYHSDGFYYIELLTEKDDDRVKYKLPLRATDIYEKYKNYIYDNNLAFPVISNQKFNDHLKEIGKIAKLKGEWIDYEYRLQEKIVIKTPKHALASHTARRTFICLALNEGAPLDLIAKITSHSDVKAMAPYIQATLKGTNLVIDAIDKTTKRSEIEDFILPE